ncbi:MAG: M20/M25/M40 family metallo-hydrolase [Actinomycetota bacterium]|nr:M20/M25/M40 family metallo-hydrolase [Actinomycetota bacterium]
MQQAPPQLPPDAARRRILVVVVLVLVALIGAILALAVTGDSDGGADSPGAQPPGDLARQLEKAVTVDGIMAHLEALQAIADDNGGNRFTASPGHEASIDYVAGVLTEAGYQVSYDDFDVTVYDEQSPAVLEQIAPVSATFEPSNDFSAFSFAPSGDVTGSVFGVGIGGANGPSGGCDEEAFTGFPAGDVALVQAGPCTLTEQVLNAQSAGAVAVLMMFPEDLYDTSTGVLRPTLASADGDVPALAVSSALGKRLGRGGVEVHIEIDATVERRTTRNVIADMPHETEEVMMVGGHLDSVLDGPGINDNGSGVASILELAVQMAGVETREAVRFAFWSGEELGLLGSQHYVDGLAEDELERISAYLNFDMVGSPNFLRLVYGDQLGNVEDPAAIKNLFLDYFDQRDLPTDLIDLSGRSDHGPFERAGIPVGGLFTGAEMLKSRQSAEQVGGEAGEPADPCYHLACDDIDNVNRRSLDQMSDAIAFSVASLATSPGI